MFKKLVGIMLLSTLTSLAIADEASVKKAVEAAYPKFKVESVTKTPYAGLYEVFMGGQIVYTDEKMSFLIAEGRLVNLGAAEGHPASVMDMSFSDQALTAEWLIKSAAGLGAGLHDVPTHIDKEVARLKLASMGVSIDSLTPAQELYLNSWEHGS